MTDTILYRKLTLEDVPMTWALFKELMTEKAEVSFCEVDSIDHLKEWVNNAEHLTYVAIDSSTGKVVGALRGKRENTEQKRHSVFLTAATLKDYRGHQVAKKLTEFGLSEMKNEGVKIARIYVYSDNTASLNAVKKLGFEASGRVVMHHWDPVCKRFVDDLIFHKKLD
ncbi:GNAT family N-acetyltransferase [Fusibacter tunisiensis]|uniref:Ribosomal protein S18 acetylase RimI-like enzyme n=1 Tax=Fusibacter tunisiensis TaxID=1008308 RepID=A0ABS2MQM8_9FIRM|nr:GNAT family N-acetyltransferase [Fusibacter tunisiensis]MBM7561712.1 ribosomal protein S18 acetylase RimI-like enzyme [Fusibacter tunisiensis]